MCSIKTSRRDARCLEQLEREICELAAHLAAATCRWLLLIAEFDERGGWADWGAKSCAHWLSARCSIGLVTAREHLRVARSLRDLPIVRKRFSNGELTYCKVRALTRVATPQTEEGLVEIARHATGAQLEKLVRGYGRALAATTEAARELHERRELTYHREDDGSLRLSARLSPEDGAVVVAALEAAERSPIADPSDSAESPEQNDHPSTRRADALTSIARTALASGTATEIDEDPAELVVHVDAASLAGDRVHERCELADGPALAPETARRLGCDGSVVRIIERDGRPLSVSRRKRTISAAMRRALRRRDDGCRFPGCTHRKFIHAHHIHHWARGGPTTLDNLVQLCSYHHRLVHEGGFSVERTREHGLRFRRRDGRLIEPSKAAPPAWGAGLEQQNRRRGLELDADTCRPRSAGDRLDYGLAVELLFARAPVFADP
jgi:Domain of unknown function (DUF222)/HNH endonuclease